MSGRGGFVRVGLKDVGFGSRGGRGFGSGRGRGASVPAAGDGDDGEQYAEANKDDAGDAAVADGAVDYAMQWFQRAAQDHDMAQMLYAMRKKGAGNTAPPALRFIMHPKSASGRLVRAVVVARFGNYNLDRDRQNLFDFLNEFAKVMYAGGPGDMYESVTRMAQDIPVGKRGLDLANLRESDGMSLAEMKADAKQMGGNVTENQLWRSRFAVIMAIFAFIQRLVRSGDNGELAEMANEVDAAPWPGYGKRGTFVMEHSVQPNDQTRAKYGETYLKATAEQQQHRFADGYVGRGVYESNRNHFGTGYEGDGAYFGRKLGSMMAPVLSSIPRVGKWVADRAPDVMDDIENVGLKRARTELGRVQGAWRAPALGISEGLRRYMGDGSYWGPLQEMDVPRQYDGDPMMPDGTVNTVPNGPRLQTNMIVDPGSVFSRRPPSITTANDETGDLIVSHREYLEDIAPGTADGFETVRMIQLNAGLADSFPLLAKFARYYSEYEFQQLIIRYRSLITEGNASAAGSVIISTFYNPDAPVYTSKRQAENAEYTASGKVTDPIVAGIECDGKKQVLGGGLLYVRRGPLGSTNDLHTYDMGKVQIATAGATAGLTIGELWVEYTVRLSKLSNTNLLEPLQKGEGMCYSSMFPESADMNYASGQIFGVESPHSGTMPWTAGWVSSILSGKLSSPGVYRWNEYAINNNHYLPGKGGNLPYNQSLVSSVPMIGGFSSSPNLLMDVQTHAATLTFTTVPGAVYTFAYTMRLEPPAFNTSIDSASLGINNYNITTQIPPIFSSSTGAGTNLPTHGYNPDQAEVGTLVDTDYRNANYGGIRASVVSGPVRFPNGTVEETTSIVPVDGSSMTSRAFLVQAAMTFAVNGNTGGTAVVHIENIGGNTNYSASFVALKYDSSGVTPAVQMTPTSLSGEWKVTAFTTSFKRVK